MNRIKVWLLLVVMITGGQEFKTFGAQPPTPVPWSCSEFGQIVLVGNGNMGKPGTATGAPGGNVNTREGGTVFVRVNTGSSEAPVTPATAEKLFTIHYAVNGTGYNPIDGCMYAMPIAGYTGLAAQGGVSGDTTLLRIDAAGTVTLYTLKAPNPLPAGNGYKGGTVDANGIFYLTDGSNNTHIFAIDLKPLANNPDPATLKLPTVAITLSGQANNTINLPDIVFDPLDGNLYGVESYLGTGQVATAISGQLDQISNINLTAGTATLTRLGTAGQFTGQTSPDVAFGALYISYNLAGTQATLIGWSNATGNFYEWPLYPPYSNRTTLSTGGAITPLLSGYNAGTGGGITGNDGASCPGLNADVMITKNDTMMSVATNATTTYTVVVSNLGPSTATDIFVTDTMPTGIAAGDMKWKVTALNDGPPATPPNPPTTSSSVSSSTPLGTLFTGILGDHLTLPPGGSAVYQVSITVRNGYMGELLVNVASATPSNFTIDPNLSNNSDYDADYVNPPFLPVNPNVRVSIRKE